MSSHQLTKTASRSVLGTMNDFAYLAAAQRVEKNSTDLVELSLQLAQTALWAAVSKPRQPRPRNDGVRHRTHSVTRFNRFAYPALTPVGPRSLIEDALDTITDKRDGGRGRKVTARLRSIADAASSCKSGRWP